MLDNLNQTQNQDLVIKPIAGIDTIPIRHAVLRQGKPIEACFIDQDNLESTFHFGLYFKNKLVAVCTFVSDHSTLFNDSKQYRLRAMGVLDNYQGMHFGKQLLNFGVDFLKTKQVDRLWFNARIVALNFYKNNGFETIGEIFDIPEVGPHYVMHKSLK